MVKHLFKDFLTDKAEYGKARKYWDDLLGELFSPLAIKCEKRLNFHYINGEEILDGNPMADRYFESLKKMIRIIQNEVSQPGLSLDVWTEEKEINKDEKASELVVSLELSEESVKIVKELLKKWIIEDYSIEAMERYIETEIYQKA